MERRGEPSGWRYQCFVKWMLTAGERRLVNGEPGNLLLGAELCDSLINNEVM